MAIQLSDLTRRAALAVTGLAVAAAVVAGCSSSGGGNPSPDTTVNGGGSNSSSSNGGGSSSSSSSGGGGGSVIGNAFCSGFKASDLAGISDASNAADVVKVWDRFAKDAPSEIKTQVQEVDKYLHDYVDKNYTALQSEAAKLTKDAQDIGAYFAAHCHA